MQSKRVKTNVTGKNTGKTIGKATKKAPPKPPKPSRLSLSTAVDETNNSAPDNHARPHLQVIVLGPSGGPLEDRITGFLVRSTSTAWAPDSMIAVDAGTLLGGIYRSLCESKSIDSSPFAGLQLPQEDPNHAPDFNPKVIAGYIFQRIIASICLTHAHFDHISGLVINSPFIKGDGKVKGYAQENTGPKIVAGLEGVISALKDHVFNNTIWPNLTDENGGAGLIRFRCLREAGHVNESGYTQLCEGLSVNSFRLNHGSCSRSSSHHTHNMEFPLDYASTLPRVTSTAFFLRDILTGTEVLIFGDVEPDSLCDEKCTLRVWEAAAPKVQVGHLRHIFIECSYNDSVGDDQLFGHLCPRHLVRELQSLAMLVRKQKYRAKEARTTADPAGVKKKHSRGSEDHKESPSQRTRSKKHQRGGDTDDSSSSLQSTQAPSHTAEGDDTHEDMMSIDDETLVEWYSNPLDGLRVYIIHIKDDMDEEFGKRILNEVQSKVKDTALGCEVNIVHSGQSIYI